jgi:hypothetical protein
MAGDQVLDEFQGVRVGGLGAQRQRAAVRPQGTLPAGKRDRPGGLRPFHLHLFGQARPAMIALVPAGPVPHRPALAGVEMPALVAEVLAELGEVAAGTVGLDAGFGDQHRVSPAGSWLGRGTTAREAVWP